MRKIILSLTFIISLFLTNSCSRENELNENVSNGTVEKGISTNASARFTNLSEEELAIKLSEDANFIESSNVLISFFEDMPNRENFQANYTQNNFQNGGEAYFIELSGYSNTDIVTKLNVLDKLFANLYDEYPQLKYDGKNQIFIESVVEKANAIVEANQANSGKIKPACQACITKWKPRIYAATLIGGIVGSLGGWQGAWGGAVIGFAGAGWGAVDCLEAAGC